LFAIHRKRRPDKSPPEALSPELAKIYADARNGHVTAQTIWAQALLDGTGLPANPAQARIWFAIAASAGYPPALNMQGRCLERGWGGLVDLPAAATAYQAAWAKGEVWGAYNLANMALRGRGIPQDRPRAWSLFHAAAQLGHAKSMNLVARFLEEGWDRPIDRPTAAQWYRRSAEAGDYRGMHNLAVLLAEQGQLEDALHWWNRALPDATPDIIAAMHAILPEIPHPAAKALQTALPIPKPEA